MLDGPSGSGTIPALHSTILQGGGRLHRLPLLLCREVRLADEMNEELRKLIQKSNFKLPYESPLTLQQLLSKTFEPSREAIISQGLLNRGSLMVLGGPPKAYKSFVLKSLAYHLATGTPLFGVTKALRADQRKSFFEIAQSQRVLILEQEIGEYDLQIRFDQMLRGITGPERTLCLEKILTHSCDHEMQFDTDQGVEHIGRLIEDAKADVVMFDPLIEFHTGEENSAKDMSKAMYGLSYLREKYHFAAVLSHHTAKPKKENEREGADNLRGSSALYAKGDTFIMLNPERKKPGVVKATFSIRRGRPIPTMFLRVNKDTLRTEFDHWLNDSEA